MKPKHDNERRVLGCGLQININIVHTNWFLSMEVSGTTHFSFYNPCPWIFVGIKVDDKDKISMHSIIS